MTSESVNKKKRSSTLIAALPAIERARQRFFNWQEKIRIVAVARLCYPGVRDEPFPIVNNYLNTRLCGDTIVHNIFRYPIVTKLTPPTTTRRRTTPRTVVQHRVHELVAVRAER